MGLVFFCWEREKKRRKKEDERSAGRDAESGRAAVLRSLTFSSFPSYDALRSRGKKKRKEGEERRGERREKKDRNRDINR